MKLIVKYFFLDILFLFYLFFYYFLGGGGIVVLGLDKYIFSWQTCHLALR